MQAGSVQTMCTEKLKQYLQIVVMLLFSLYPLVYAGDKDICQFQVVETLPHDNNNFTQGLLLYQGKLFESVGGYGESKLIEYQWPNLEKKQVVELPRKLFAEGIAIADGRLFQLTWKTGDVIVYRAHDLSVERTYFFGGEGWGLALYGDRLVRSDGSHCLHYHRTNNFHFTRKVCLPKKQYRLNALAVQDGVIYANDYPTDRILRIDQKTHQILDTIDLTALRSGYYAGISNGIAAMSSGEILVTGKNWDKMYRIDVSACRAATAK